MLGQGAAELAIGLEHCASARLSTVHTVVAHVVRVAFAVGESYRSDPLGLGPILCVCVSILARRPKISIAPPKTEVL